MSGSAVTYGSDPGAAPSIELNPGRRTTTLRVSNTGDRAVQVGSHYHFFEANPALAFDREAAWGMHLSIPSGLAVRFEPGDTREVELVDFGGRRILHGFAGLTEGALDDPDVRARALGNLPDFLASNAGGTSDISGDDLPSTTGESR